MLGDIGRGVAAYMGPGVFLDVALTWVFGSIETCSHDRPSKGIRDGLTTHTDRCSLISGSS